MRRIAIVVAFGVLAAGLATWAMAATNDAGTTTHAGMKMPAGMQMHQGMHVQTVGSACNTYPLPCAAYEHAAGIGTQPAAPRVASTPGLAAKLAVARLATAKYVTDLARAKADGYRSQITPMMPDMGIHFLNPKVKGFDVTKPPILVYEKRGSRWQLGAFEWVFPAKPKTPPLPGATYGSFGAACHYVDGEFVFQADQNACAKTSPKSGAAFGFWHPDFVTLHVWLWYPNPDGIYAGMNPLVHPFNAG